MQTQGTAAVVPPSRRLAHTQHSAFLWSPLLALALVFAWSQLGSLGTEDADPLRLDAAPLPEPRARCQVASDGSAARAQLAERAALDKIARYPFAPGEGLRACELLAEAESCATAAQDPVASARLRARSAAWHTRLEREYRDRLTRYRRARISGRSQQALSDVLFLLELLSAYDGPFPAQLRRVRLELEAAVEAEAA